MKTRSILGLYIGQLTLAISWAQARTLYINNHNQFYVTTWVYCFIFQNGREKTFDLIYGR